MPLIIPEGFIQVTLQWSGNTFDSGVAVSTFGMGAPLGPDPVDLQEAADGITLIVESTMIGQMDGSTTFVGTQVDGAVESAFAASGAGGGRATEAAPPNVALLVKKTTSRRGRRAQGRLFWPSILARDEVSETGAVASTRLTTLQTLFTDFYDDLVALFPAEVVILQNSEGISPPLSPPPVVTGFQVDGRVASQRRRLRA